MFYLMKWLKCCNVHGAIYADYPVLPYSEATFAVSEGRNDAHLEAALALATFRLRKSTTDRISAQANQSAYTCAATSSK